MLLKVQNFLKNSKVLGECIGESQISKVHAPCQYLIVQLFGKFRNVNSDVTSYEVPATRSENDACPDPERGNWHSVALKLANYNRKNVLGLILCPTKGDNQGL